MPRCFADLAHRAGSAMYLVPSISKIPNTGGVAIFFLARPDAPLCSLHWFVQTPRRKSHVEYIPRGGFFSGARKKKCCNPQCARTPLGARDSGKSTLWEVCRINNVDPVYRIVRVGIEPFIVQEPCQVYACARQCASRLALIQKRRVSLGSS